MWIIRYLGVDSNLKKGGVRSGGLAHRGHEEQAGQVQQGREQQGYQAIRYRKVYSVHKKYLNALISGYG